MSVACGAVITADVTLSSDLYCPGSDGLSIQAANVTIDLAGHTISGNGSGVGIFVAQGGVTVRDGTISNFVTGIDEPSFIGDDLLVDGMTISHNLGDGIFTDQNHRHNRVLNSSIFSNGLNGIEASFADDEAVYQNDHIYLNAENGIYVDEGTSSFIGNDVRRNGLDGIHVFDLGSIFAPGYHFKDNVVDRNGQQGIRVFIQDSTGAPLPVGDDGGNEAKLNADPTQCSSILNDIGIPAQYDLGLTCSARPDQSKLSYTGDAAIRIGGTARLSAILSDPADLDTPLQGGSVQFQLGSQSCSGPTDSQGKASCTLMNVPGPLGPRTLSATFDGDTNDLPSSASTQATVFAFPSRGAFTLGDLSVASASAATILTWWGNNWSALNSLSGGTAPASYRGFADRTSTAVPTCGGTWASAPGASFGGPPSAVPSYMGTVVTSKVSKTATAISGNIIHIVVIKTNPGYQPSRGRPGTGTVVATSC